jgi:tetraacyldisaccharide 4'-kinase
MNLPLPIRILLWPLSVFYEIGARLRVLLYEKGVFKKKRLKTPVVSVGNLTVGGTGKTPMVLYLAEKFLAEGKRVGILSRGYRGAAGTSDEVEMLKRRLGGRVVFGVGADRFVEGERIERESPVDVFLLDDGFQHLQLARDVDIVLWDGTKKFQRQWMLPAGSLREPISAISRADLLVITRKTWGTDGQNKDVSESAFSAQTKLAGFRKLGMTAIVSSVEGPAFAFCGVGNPKAFFNDLRRWEIEPVGTMSFPDHHRYTKEDAAQLTNGASYAGAGSFVTTEKDEQNLQGVDFGEWPIYVAVVELEVNPAQKFHSEIRRLLNESRGSAA